jgi:hypothetical protein
LTVGYQSNLALADGLTRILRPGNEGADIYAYAYT